MLILLLCFIFSSTFASPRYIDRKFEDVNLKSVRIGDTLSPIVSTGQRFEKNRVLFEKYQNWKTGGTVNISIFPVGHVYMIITAQDYPKEGFYWILRRRFEDGYPGEEPYACASHDYKNPKVYEEDEIIRPGETKIFKNGTVLVNCDSFEGSLRRVSEAVSGCFYDNNVYKLEEQWDEPIAGEDYLKIMKCVKSDEGYFESKVVGCSVCEYRSNTTFENGTVFSYCNSGFEMWLNTTRWSSGMYKKCVETEPGHVKLIESEENKVMRCFFDGVTYETDKIWTDKKRGAVFRCTYDGNPVKESCQIGAKRIKVGEEVKLVNGCTFLCHPQTNVYSCDNSMNMFELVKERKIPIIEVKML